MNVNSIRQKVATAISKAPLDVVVLRENKVSDGCGGYFIPEDNKETIVAKIQGILDNSSSETLTDNANPGGKAAYSRSPQFITIWQEGVTFKKGDYFILDGVKYEIFNPVNILNMNIYWTLNLQVYVDKEED